MPSVRITPEITSETHGNATAIHHSKTQHEKALTANSVGDRDRERFACDWRAAELAPAEHLSGPVDNTRSLCGA